jgi:hypothetical protein
MILVAENSEDSDPNNKDKEGFIQRATSMKDSIITRVDSPTDKMVGEIN